MERIQDRITDVKFDLYGLSNTMEKVLTVVIEQVAQLCVLYAERIEAAIAMHNYDKFSIGMNVVVEGKDPVIVKTNIAFVESKIKDEVSAVVNVRQEELPI